MRRSPAETSSRGTLLSWPETLPQWQERVGVRGLAAAMLIALTVVILASLVRVPYAQFGLSAKVDGLTLETAVPVEFEDLTSASVDIAGIRSSRWSSAQDVIAEAVSGLRAEGAGGVVTLSGLRIPEGWNLTLEAEAPGRHRILANPSLTATQAALATLTIAVPKGASIKVVDTDNTTTERTAEADQDIFLTLGRVDISIRLSAERRDFARLLRLSAITLCHYNTDQAGTARAELSEVGSIRSGSLWIAHVAGPPKDLGLLDRITIAGIGRGAASLVLEAGL